MPQIIDGTLCFDCGDVARVQRAHQLGISPARILPDGEIKPKAPQAGEARRGAPVTGVNSPLSTGDKGRTLNLLT